MTGHANTRADMDTALQRVFIKFKITIGVSTFVFGLSLMLFSTGRPGAWWSLVGNVGTFVAAAVAIPFYYEVALRDTERHIVKEQLSELLDDKLFPQKTRCAVHSEGRFPVAAKRAFIQSAKFEVCEVGIALRSLVSYFDQRPEQDFFQPVSELISKGVSFTYILLDPDSEAAAAYARDTDDPELPQRIRHSIARLLELGTTLTGNAESGKFSVRVSRTCPSCSLIIVDPDADTGRALVTTYLLGVKRASSPVLEILAGSSRSCSENT
ncbi:MAG: hypothetical protein ACRDP6_32090 [Actinoallomurus sp.]